MNGMPRASTQDQAPGLDLFCCSNQVLIYSLLIFQYVDWFRGSSDGLLLAFEETNAWQWLILLEWTRQDFDVLRTYFLLGAWIK